MSKRLFDLLLTGLGLLAFSPLLLLVALAVKLDSPGPVFFRQVRVGRRGREFRIHKFRTMRVDAERLGAQITVGRDPRITRVGALLRASKIDELPQLLDVLQGTMSLVGPRPEVPRYVALYPADVRKLVLSVRPGITDLASIEYRDESGVLARAVDPHREYVEVILPNKLRLAAEYVRRQSLGLDVAILWRTGLAIVRG